MLIFTASEVETAGLGAGISPAFAGLLGGMAGGVAQAYATMGKVPYKDMPKLSQYTQTLQQRRWGGGARST